MNPLIFATIGLTIAIGALLVAGFALSQDPGVGEHTHPGHVESKELTEVESALEKRIETERLYNISLNKTMLEMQATLQLHQDEIIKNKKLLQLAQLGTGDTDIEKLKEQGTKGDFGITIHLDSDVFLRGEIVWISGTSEPGKPVTAVIRHPNIDRIDISERAYITEPTANADQQGNFKIGFATKFDSRLGEFTLYVKSQGKTSNELSFTLKE